MAIKFRSKFEKDFYSAYQPAIQGYELDRVGYTLAHTYTPDFKVGPMTFIETKGIFHSADRTKLMAVLRQHPEVKLAMVFQRATNLLYKGAKSNYGDWCEKRGIPWFDFKDRAGIEQWIKDNT